MRFGYTMDWSKPCSLIQIAKKAYHRDHPGGGNSLKIIQVRGLVLIIQGHYTGPNSKNALNTITSWPFYLPYINLGIPYTVLM